MKFKKPLSLQELASFLNADFEGDPNLPITGINEIHKVEGGDVVFVDHKKYYSRALNSAADVIIINQKVQFPEGKGIIITEHPFDAFNQITKHHQPYKPWINDHGDEFEVGEGSHIHPNVSIGHNVKIGKGSIIHSGATICDNTTIGDHVIIGPNSVIGFDAFYYKKKEHHYEKMHTCGSTTIANHAEIGALVTIDRGVTGDTYIGEGTKIDNQVHIGHDTVIGKHCLMAANVGIAGCVTIKDHVTLWGQVGVISDIIIEDHVTVLAQSGVGRSLQGPGTYFGSPAEDARSKWKEMAAIKKLPTIIENL